MATAEFTLGTRSVLSENDKMDSLPETCMSWSLAAVEMELVKAEFINWNEARFKFTFWSRTVSATSEVQRMDDPWGKELFRTVTELISLELIRIDAKFGVSPRQENEAALVASMMTPRKNALEVDAGAILIDPTALTILILKRLKLLIITSVTETSVAGSSLRAEFVKSKASSEFWRNSQP